MHGKFKYAILSKGKLIFLLYHKKIYVYSVGLSFFLWNLSKLGSFIHLFAYISSHTSWITLSRMWWSRKFGINKNDKHYHTMQPLFSFHTSEGNIKKYLWVPHTTQVLIKYTVHMYCMIFTILWSQCPKANSSIPNKISDTVMKRKDFKIKHKSFKYIYIKWNDTLKIDTFRLTLTYCNQRPLAVTHVWTSFPSRSISQVSRGLLPLWLFGWYLTTDFW